MTLHWWMHWFWVTLLLTLIGSSKLGLAAPPTEATPTEPDSAQHRPAERQARAMYFTKSPQIVATRPPIINVTELTSEETTYKNTSQDNTTAVTPILWTPVNATIASVAVSNITNVTISRNVAQNTTFAPKRRNLTRPDLIKDENVDIPPESRIVTEKPLSLETTLLQTKIPPIIESSRQVIEPASRMDTGTIAGISFAALALTALAGSTGFVLYRRRYLNKPQTLNDKCSNPDSSGYLDDSTIRDNSEEMYSLDNDSFLNSLEAMTIQNYWTDTVKHTKL